MAARDPVDSFAITIQKQAMVVINRIPVTQPRKNQLSTAAVAGKIMMGNSTESHQKRCVKNIATNQNRGVARGFSQIDKGIVIQAVVMDKPNVFVRIPIGCEAFIIRLRCVGAVSDKHRYPIGGYAKALKC